MDGGAVVLTLKDQSILADGDINEGKQVECYSCMFWLCLWGDRFLCNRAFWYDPTDVDMLENVEIGEQKHRDDAYKAAKKKTGVYDDK